MLHITADGVIEHVGKHVRGMQIVDWVDGELAEKIIETLEMNDDGLSGKVKAAPIHFGGKSPTLRWYTCTFDANWSWL